MEAEGVIQPWCWLHHLMKLEQK